MFKSTSQAPHPALSFSRTFKPPTSCEQVNKILYICETEKPDEYCHHQFKESLSMKTLEYCQPQGSGLIYEMQSVYQDENENLREQNKFLLSQLRKKGQRQQNYCRLIEGLRKELQKQQAHNAALIVQLSQIRGRRHIGVQAKASSLQSSQKAQQNYEFMQNHQTQNEGWGDKFGQKLGQKSRRKPLPTAWSR